MKVLIVGGNSQYHDLFKLFGFEPTDQVLHADLICFTGGADVSPHLYGDRAHPATFNDTARDARELDLFNEAEELGKPMVGICRGGQFLNVMNGGRMYQHVQNHALHGGHILTDVHTGEEVFVSSTHHQMMMPAEHAVIVATAKEGGDREWFSHDVFFRDNSEEDYEVLFYPQSNSLCFQPHPEFTEKMYDGMRSYFRQCINRFLNI